MTDDQTPAVPLAEQILAAGREVGMRRGVYAKWVQSGRMTQNEADAAIAAMAAIYGTLKWVQKHRARLIELAPELREDAP